MLAVEVLAGFAVSVLVVGAALCVFVALRSVSLPAGIIQAKPKAWQRARLVGFGVILVSMLGALACVALEAI